MAAMGYVQLHGRGMTPEAALQAVRDMREGLAGGASLEVRRWLDARTGPELCQNPA